MTAIALQFQNTQFNIIDRNSSPWLRQSEIVCALYGVTKGGGQSDAPFENAEKSLKRLFQRNADEFTESMTALIELETNGGKQQVRIFSLRGCHLLAMFARTEIAKQFRKWVLDVLEQHSQPSIEPPTLTKAQQGELFTLGKAIAGDSGKIRAAVWSRFQNHFRLSSYKDLPADRYNEALAYLEKLRLEYSGQSGLESAKSELSGHSEQLLLGVIGRMIEQKLAERVTYSAPLSAWKLSNQVGSTGWLTFDQMWQLEQRVRPLALLLAQLKQDGYDIQGAEVEYQGLLTLVERFYSRLNTLREDLSKFDQVGFRVNFG